MFGIFEAVVFWAIGLVEAAGYAGIFLTMALESAAIPIPSEVVVPFGGFLAATGKMDFWAVALIATLANLVGCALLYFIGLKGGRPLAERYGKYFLVHKDDIQKFDGWIARYGAKTAFFSRLLPGVRTFSAFFLGASAGAVKFSVFAFYTGVGSFVWNVALTYAGFVLGANWGALRGYFEKFNIVITILAMLALAAFILRHLRMQKKNLTPRK